MNVRVLLVGGVAALVTALVTAGCGSQRAAAPVTSTVTRISVVTTTGPPVMETSMVTTTEESSTTVTETAAATIQMGPSKEVTVACKLENAAYADSGLGSLLGKFIAGDSVTIGQLSSALSKWHSPKLAGTSAAVIELTENNFVIETAAGKSLADLGKLDADRLGAGKTYETGICTGLFA